MASTDFRVLTPERVSLQYDIAGIGSRGAAVLIDTVLQFIVLSVLLVALSGATAAGLTRLTAGGDTATVIVVIAVMALGIFVVTFGYFIVFEIIWNGQTPGKRLVGLRVIRETGYPIRPVDAVIRNLVRILDYLPFGYAVGVIAMLFNARAKRLGDFAAGTIVVREGSYSTLAAHSIPETTTSLTLRPEDATLVRDFLVRRSGMNPSARATLAMRLATAIGSRYGLAVETDPERFLEGLGA